MCALIYSTNSTAYSTWHQKSRQQQACALQVEFFNFVALRLLHTPLSFFSTARRKRRVGGESEQQYLKTHQQGRSLARSRTHTHYNNGAAAGGILARLNVLMVTQSEPQ
jgi:hypothetical protein